MMAAKSLPQDPTAVRVGSRLSKAFERVEDRIRERAYEIFQGRSELGGDPVGDWLDAQWQFLSPVELVVKEQKKNVVVEGCLKGFAPKEIEVEVNADGLRVFGSHTESKSGTKRGVKQSSSETVHFYQSVPLPCEVDAGASDAKILKNGKLKITLPKKVAKK